MVNLGAPKASKPAIVTAIAKVKGGKKASTATKKSAKKSSVKSETAVASLMGGAKKGSATTKKDGKKSQGKKSIGSKPPTTPLEGKRSGGTTGNMTVNQYRAFLQQVKK